MRSLLIDDEILPRQNLKRLIRNHCPHLHVVGEADSIESGRQAIQELEPDLVFLDVEMPGGSGFDLLESLKDIPFGVIFVTGHEKYALKAIRFSALDYLLKPVQVEDLRETIMKFTRSRTEDHSRKIEHLRNNRIAINKLAVPSQDGIQFIPVSDIIRCEADGNYTLFMLRNGEKILVATTLKEYEELLDSHCFFRIHHAHLINLKAVKRYLRGEGGTVILENGEAIAVSRRRKQEFLRLMQEGCIAC